MSKVKACLVVVCMAIIGASGCGGSDMISVEVQQKEGSRDFVVGEPRTLVISTFGGGDRFRTGWYEGPVDLTFGLPEGITVEPDSAKIDMKPAKGASRNRSSVEVTLHVRKDAAVGEQKLTVEAVTEAKTTAQTTFIFQVRKKTK